MRQEMLGRIRVDAKQDLISATRTQRRPLFRALLTVLVESWSTHESFVVLRSKTGRLFGRENGSPAGSSPSLSRLLVQLASA
jgi:hypothetical protein